MAVILSLHLFLLSRIDTGRKCRHTLIVQKPNKTSPTAEGCSLCLQQWRGNWKGLLGRGLPGGLGRGAFYGRLVIFFQSLSFQTEQEGERAGEAAVGKDGSGLTQEICEEWLVLAVT